MIVEKKDRRERLERKLIDYYTREFNLLREREKTRRKKERQDIDRKIERVKSCYFKVYGLLYF